ncbi:protein translocase subunit SecF [Candidatus Woesebacteria bacterium]|nr:protein translocase subunit SecF [Candidatus Woesebacteria bacterium]
MKYRKLYFLFSTALVLISLVSLAVFRLKPSVDFTGGSLIEVSVENTDYPVDDLYATLQDVYQPTSIQFSGEKQVLLKGPTIPADSQEPILTALAQKTGQTEVIRFEVVGPTISGELLYKTGIAIVLVAGVITLYVWRQFSELKYGVCAVTAMLHDSLILLGVFSLLGHYYDVYVDVLFVTALLTTLSFSIHDTVVVFHRILELKQKNRRQVFETTVNDAIVETVSRSINNSVTIIVMLAALVLLGGETIRWFSVALLVGAVVGTYSSTFLAAPLLILWDEVAEKRRLAIKNKKK